MFPEDWQRLGLEAPSADLATIKRAYAARLKRTRPDDDAEAYQALRQAYERAQQWARWEHEQRPEPGPESAGGPAPAVAQTSAATAQEVAADVAEAGDAAAALSTLPSFTSPEALVERAHGRWRDGGERALIEHWPELRAGLDALPLVALPEVSARLADLVIHVPQLPDAFVVGLQRHFGWLDDFRTARLIGNARVQALHEVLDDRIVRPVTDPALLAELEPVLLLARLQRQQQHWRAQARAVLEGGVPRQLFEAVAPRRWRQFGLDHESQKSLRALFSRTQSLRTGLLVALLAAAMALWGEPPAQIVALLLVGGIATLLSFFVAMWLTGSLGGWFGLRQQQTAFAARLRQWHAHPRRLPVALALLAGSALGGAWAGGPWAPAWPLLPWLPWFFFALLGAMAAWPADLRHGAVAIGAIAIGSYAFGRWLPATSPWIGTWPAVALSLALLWVLLACAAYERGWWGTRQSQGALLAPAAWAVSPIVNSLALCDRWGYLFALAPVPAMLALANVGIVGHSGWSILVGWMLLVLAFGYGQNLLHRWAQRIGAA
jgi:hypothetical protein